MLEIRKVRSKADIGEVKTLIGEFWDFIAERYPERKTKVDEYLAEQNFDEQLANFDKYFAPPFGECILALKDGRSIGILMMKAHNADLCEMNRMFVRPEGRGAGVGRKLCKALISEAKKLGFKEMRLDAWDRHREALPLYESLGFVPEPEDPNRDSLRICLRLNLQETEA